MHEPHGASEPLNMHHYSTGTLRLCGEPALVHYFAKPGHGS